MREGAFTTQLYLKVADVVLAAHVESQRKGPLEEGEGQGALVSRGGAVWVERHTPPLPWEALRPTHRPRGAQLPSHVHVFNN